VRHSAAQLAAGIDARVELQEQLLALAGDQRAAIMAGDHEAVDAGARAAETVALRLASAEAERQAAAQTLADELGSASTRWSALSDAVADDERLAIQPRVDLLERSVRELEPANAVNGQLITQEIELVDMQIRGLVGGGPAPSPQAYTRQGGRADTPAVDPRLLNASA